MIQQDDEYIGSDKPEILEIEFDGPPLDVYTLAHLNYTLHSIANRVALLDGRYFPEFPFRFFRHYHPFPFVLQPQLVRLRVDQIKSGSLKEVVTLLVAAVFSDEGARAILQNLSANIIWAIANSGLRGIRSKLKNETPPGPLFPEPFEIGPELGETVRQISNNCRERRCKFIFRSRRANGEVQEVMIDINGEE